MEGALPAGADPGLRLIETLRGDCDGARLARHRARMAAAAAGLGWGFDPRAFDAEVARLRAAGGGGVDGGGAAPLPLRLRLTLDGQGQIAGRAEPLARAEAEWRIALSPRRLWSGDPWLRIKSTRRALYDETRAGLAGQGLEEAIFANERGEICEGTITTLFFDRGQGMRTPPLACGLLPGVLRGEMACREERLEIGQLAQEGLRLWVGNSLRGLIPARLVPWP